MPRKRVIDPEFWSDEEIGSWSFQARLFYIGLWNFADDEGKFKANDSLLKAQIFPYDDDVILDDIKKYLGDKILWYKVDTFSYGYIRNFNRYQRIDRPTPSKIPNPKELDESSTSPRGSLDPNISKDKIIQGFDEFWSKYPRKVGKEQARKAFSKAAVDNDLLNTMLSAIDLQGESESWKKDDGKFIPHPATWINGKRWEDEVAVKKENHYGTMPNQKF